MRIISVGSLKAFRQVPEHRDAEQPLRPWVREVRAASWPDLTAIKRMFNSADMLGDERVVFDTGGNKSRFIAQVNYHCGVVYMRIVGTPREYDSVDARTI